jgi:hypothetical protein
MMAVASALLSAAVRCTNHARIARPQFINSLSELLPHQVLLAMLLLPHHH